MPWKNKEDRLANQRRWYRERRAGYLTAAGPCSVCGSTEGLVFAADENAVTRNAKGVCNWSKKRLEQELAQRRVLCGKCAIEARPQRAVTKQEKRILGESSFTLADLRAWVDQRKSAAMHDREKQSPK